MPVPEKLFLEVYKDLAQPGIQQIGKAIETVVACVNTLLIPVEHWNEKKKQIFAVNMEKYREKIADIPEEKIIPVANEIGVPIIERLTYIQDDSIANLYIELLKRASSSDTVSQVHPAFISTIGLMAPEEAVLIKHFANGTAHPVCRANLTEKKTGSSYLIKDFIVPPEFSINVDSKNIPLFLSNMEHLGIIDISYISWLAEESHYEHIKNPLIPELKRKKILHKGKIINLEEDPYDITFENGLLRATEFGRRFIVACDITTFDTITVYPGQQ